MPSVDTRVVELSFDNSDFESKVDPTIRSIKNLEKSLQFSGSQSGLEKVSAAAKKVNLSPIADAVETVTAKFSLLQMVAFSAVQNITNSFINSAKSLITAIPKQIWSGGWTRAMNLEKAQFQIEGLGASWKDLYKDISYAVDGTAYGLDSAAVVASQLTASGIQAGDQMKYSLRGISGLAAMTSSSYDEIGHVYVQVAGQGRLMSQQLHMLSSRGVNAAATLAKALNVTEAEVREMVTRGEIDFDTFAKAMDDAFGEHAKKANETFSGALSNVKAALSRIGAEIATPLIKNMIPVLNALRELINGVKASLGPVFEDISSMFESTSAAAVTFIEKVTKHIGKTPAISTDTWEKSGIASEEFKNALIETARAHDIAIDKMIEDEGSFEETLKNGWLTESIFDEAVASFGDLSEASSDTRNSILSLKDSFKDVENISTFQLFILSFENLLDRVGAFGKVFKDVIKETFSVDVGLNKIRDFAVSLYEFTSNLEVSHGAISTFRAVLDGLMHTLSVISKVVKGVGEIFATAFGAIYDIASPIGLLIGDVVMEIFSLIGVLDKAMSSSEWLKSTFEGLKTAIKNFGENGGAAVKQFVDDVRELGIIPDFFQGIRDKASELAPKLVLIVNHLSSMGYAFGDFLAGIGTKFLSVMRSILGIADETESAFSGFGGVFSKVSSLIGSFISFMGGVIRGFFGEVAFAVNSFTTTGDSIANVFSGLISIGSKASSVFSGIGSSLSSFIDTLTAAGDIRASNMKSLSAAFESLISVYAKVASVIRGIQSAIFTKVADFFNSVDLQTAIKTFTMLLDTFADVFVKVFLALNFGNLMKGFSKSSSGFLGALQTLITSFASFNKVDIGGNLSNSIKQVSESLKDLQAGSKSTQLLKIAVAVGILAASMYLLASVDPASLAKALVALGGGLGVLIGSLKIMEMVFSNISSLRTMATLAVTMIAIAEAVLIMALAVKVLDGVDVSAVAKLAFVLGGMVAAVYGLSKIEKSVFGAALSLSALAVALTLLVIPIKLLGGMDHEALAQGLVAVGLSMAMLVASASALNRIGSIGRVAVELIALAIALNLLIIPIKVLGGMARGDLIQGITSLAAVLGGLVLAMLGLSKIEGSLKTAAELMVIAVALNMLIIPISKLGGMDPSQLGQGLLGLAGGLTTIIGALAVLDKLNAGSAVVQLLAVVVALTMLIGPLKTLGEMDADSLAQGLIGITLALAAVLVPLGAFTVLLNKMPTSISGKLAVLSVALLAMSVAVISLAVALTMLSAMSPQQLAVSLIGLAGGLAIIIAALFVAGKLAATLAPGVAILLGFGAAIALVGAGVFLFATGLAALATSASMAGFALKQYIDAFRANVTGIASLVAESLVAVTTSVSQVIGEIAKTIALGLADAISGFAEGFKETAPTVIQALSDMLSTLASEIEPRLPDFIAQGTALVLALLEGLGAQAPALAQGAMDLAVDLIHALATALENNGPALRGACDHLVQSLIDFLIEFITGKDQEVGEEGKTIGQSIVDGIGEGISSFTSQIWSAITDAIQGLIDKAKSLLGIASPSTVFQGIGEDIMTGLKNGIEGFLDGPLGVIENLVSTMIDKFSNSPIGKAATGFVSELTNAFQKVKKDPVDAIKSGLDVAHDAVVTYGPKLALAGTGIMGLFGGGIKAGQGEATGAVSTIMSNIKITADGAKGHMTTAGSSAMLGFAVGLKAQSSNALTAAKTAANNACSAASSVRNSMQSAGSSIGAAFASGIRGHSGSAYSAGSSIASSGRSGAGSVSFYGAGVSAVDGFINGMQSRDWRARAVASQIGSGAISALMAALRSASPSKETFKVGTWFVEGFANGMSETRKLSDYAAEDIGKSAISTLKYVHDAIENDFDFGEDFNPVITPIVDLDNVKSASSMVDSMFANSYGLGLGSTLGAYNLYGGQGVSNSKSTVYNISVALQYEAGTDANLMVSEIATGLRAKLDLEG